MFDAGTGCSRQRPTTRSIVQVHAAKAAYTRAHRPRKHLCYTMQIACWQVDSRLHTWRQGLSGPIRQPRASHTVRGNGGRR
jgi:hypothetical protein